MNLSTAFSSGRLTIYLSGELDHHEARCLMRSIDELLDEYLPRDCALDMSGLSFMDSSGIAVIIRVSRRMQALGGRAWIENPAGQPQRVIDASGIYRLVPVAMSK
ncbi:MAG: STAS domain-containing protein [Firmicutes bacterium]|nr:STAS domain-containing protein [Oscillospiraceae bacterium]MBS5432375.1 STAS domain-containing protein [Bacillota bacterium]